MNTKTLLFFACLVVACNGLAGKVSEETIAKWKEAIAKIKPVHVYGKIIDQYGNPVPEAKVKVLWVEISIPPDPGQSKWIETDENGEWNILINRPDRIFVSEIEKTGYSCDRKTNKYFNNPKTEKLCMNTSKKDPLVITIRKKGETTFLIKNSGSLYINSPYEKKRLDLFERKLRSYETKDGKTNNLPWDIEIEARQSKTEKNWYCVIKTTPGNNNGIIAKNEIVYEAPEKGYEAQYTTTIPINDTKRHTIALYTKSRNPSVYARIEVEFSAGNDGFIFSYDVWGNPYGTRNLEYDQTVAKEFLIRKKLTKEAKSMLLQGKRPKQPDLKELFKK